MRLAGDRSYGPRQGLRDGPPQPERMTSTAGQWLARPEIGGHTRRQQVMPLSHGSLVADAGAARLGAGPGLARPPDVPQLNPGVEQLGEYQGSGLTGATYLVRNARGQVVQVSGLLNLVLTGIDGRRTVSAIAARVSADNVEYLLAHKLAPLDLLIPGDGARDHAAARPDPAVLVLRLRRTLVPEAAVQHLARLFGPLFNPAVVVAALAALLASDTWLLRVGQLGPAFQFVLLRPPLLLLVLGLSVLSMLFHECGHAAACRYGGARPGVIGVGFYVVWPAFFANVTDTYRLGRAGRIRTDLGGVYFNAVFVLVLMAAYRVTGYLPLLPAVALIHMEILQQLLPSLRLDGYFILADAIGVPDLFRRIAPILRSLIPGRPADPRVQGLKRAPRVILTAWVLFVVPMLGVELTLIVVHGPGLIRTFARSLGAQVDILIAQSGRADVPAVLLSAVSVVLLVLPMAGLSYIVLLTGRRALRSLLAVNQRHPPLRLPSVVMVLALAAVLAAQWGLLPPIGGRATAPRPSAAGLVTLPRVPHRASPPPVGPRPQARPPRSEERRVGKEGGS